MEEFARMIYRQWCEKNQGRDVFHEKGQALSDRLLEILSVPLFNEIYDTFCDGCLEVEQDAFIAGFAYACKCLSDGKIELGGGAK